MTVLISNFSLNQIVGAKNSGYRFQTITLYITILFSCTILRHSRALVSGIQRLRCAQRYFSLACFAREACTGFPLVPCGNDETTVNKFHRRISLLCKTASFFCLSRQPIMCGGSLALLVWGGLWAAKTLALYCANFRFRPLRWQRLATLLGDFLTSSALNSLL